MRTFTTPVLVASTVLVLATTPAHATPPERHLPPHDVEFVDEVPPGVMCPFGVRVEIEGKEGTIVFDDRTQLLGVGTRVTVTNLETSASITASIAGPGRVVEDLAPDGSGTVTIHQYGPWLHGHPGELYLATGHVVAVVTFGPGGAFLDAQEDLSRAKVRDLCEELAS